MDYGDTLDTLSAIADALYANGEDDAEIKAGKRHSAGDQTILQSIYDKAEEICEMAVALGATEEMDEEHTGGEVEMMEGKAEDTPTVSLPTDFLIGDEVKALEGGRIGAYAVRFGSEDEPDMSHMRDYFTKSTDFWLDAWDRRPMLYHHAMDDDTADAPRIGTWTKAEVKDEGVWLEGQLDRSHRYYSAIKELVRRGILRLSSDSAPHLVRREIKEGTHTHEVKRWPLLAASLTPTPAEPRLSAVSFKSLLDELGIDPIVIDDNDLKVDASESDRSDETKALAERSRRLLLELELEQFTLEATI